MAFLEKFISFWGIQLKGESVLKWLISFIKTFNYKKINKIIIVAITVYLAQFTSEEKNVKN